MASTEELQEQLNEIKEHLKRDREARHAQNEAVNNVVAEQTINIIELEKRVEKKEQTLDEIGKTLIQVKQLLEGAFGDQGLTQRVSDMQKRQDEIEKKVDRMSYLVVGTVALLQFFHPLIIGLFT